MLYDLDRFENSKTGRKVPVFTIRVILVFDFRTLGESFWCLNPWGCVAITEAEYS